MWTMSIPSRTAKEPLRFGCAWLARNLENWEIIGASGMELSSLELTPDLDIEFMLVCTARN